MPYKIMMKDNAWLVIKKDTGKVVGKHATEEKAKKQLAALYMNVKENITWYQPISIQESGIEEGTNRRWCKIGGIALTPTISANKRKYTINSIKENDGAEVSVFSEHRPIEEHVVGKVRLSESDGVLRYDGKIRNTAAHPDIVEKCQDDMLRVSIGASDFKFGEADNDGNVVIEKLRINHLGLVGIPGVKEVTMEYAIAESYTAHVNEETEMEEDEESEEDESLNEKSNEVDNMSELEELKAKLAEKEAELGKMQESIKEQLVEGIMKLNPKLVKKELMEKDEKELKVIESYEVKLKEQEEEKGEEAAGEVADDKEEEKVNESEDLKGIIVEKGTGDITMSEERYKKFNKELRESIYN